MQILVKHIMSSPVISLFAEQTLPLAEDIMRLKHLRHIPVIDETNRLVGVVSHRDILAAQISSLTGITMAARREIQDRTKIAEIMTTDVWTAGPEMTAATAGRLLLDHRFGCLPVVDDAGLLIGIITERDFMTLAVRALDEGEETVVTPVVTVSIA
jgi:CBS domain-containing membrane protein